MESAQDEMNFGRQPGVVTISIAGADRIDIDYWMKRFIAIAEVNSDTRKFNAQCFRIYPRAVND